MPPLRDCAPCWNGWRRNLVVRVLWITDARFVFRYKVSVSTVAQAIAQEILSACVKIFCPTIVDRCAALLAQVPGAGVIELQLDASSSDEKLVRT